MIPLRINHGSRTHDPHPDGHHQPSQPNSNRPIIVQHAMVPILKTMTIVNTSLSKRHQSCKPLLSPCVGMVKLGHIIAVRMSVAFNAVFIQTLRIETNTHFSAHKLLFSFLPNLWNNISLHSSQNELSLYNLSLHFFRGCYHCNDIIVLRIKNCRETNVSTITVH
jgi:hypothetical protein